MNSLRRIDIKYLKGVGPKRADLIGRELGIKSYYDLLHHFPSHYVDRSKIYNIVDLHGEMPALQIKGKFLTFNVVGEGAKSRLIGLFSDGTATIEVVWFRRISQIKQAYKTGNEYILFGKPGEFNGTRQMVHPEIDPVGSTTATGGLRGVYPLTEKLRNAGIGSRTIFTWVMNLLSTMRPVAETLSTDVIEAMKLMPLRDALVAVHNPQDAATLQKARFRLKFEELFYIQLNLRRHSLMRAARADGIRFGRVGEFFNTFYERQLPFDLTNAQKRVIKEIRHDMGSGRQMNRLLQGDVGSGKTLVALMTMLIAIDNGYQACLMAPTEILATQHYQTLRELVAPIGINVRLLTGSTRAKERREIHEGLLSGD
ncbi:MAG: DEAD/DEAH box helicase, partial [Muribaculaceae bacterium]|nr:DEAD/DEAH box helicase [Muribaculaceae bacterium]